jgi:G:T-mismatch repair DNA endonuclease (very short patch repair protein)
MYQLKHNGPNKLERDFAAAFPELRFVGDGQLYLNDSVGAICPDFVHPSLNKAVELFGDFWHEGENPNDRISRINSVGWECLVIWESEFRGEYETVKARIAEFLSKGQNVSPSTS